MRFCDTSLTKSLPSEGGGPLAVEGVAAQTIKIFYGKNIETALHALSLTLIPRELPPRRSLLVSLSRAEKNADGCIAIRLFTPYSSTASGPPSLTREGFCKSRFWATDGGAICNRNSLGSSRAPTPTGMMGIFVSATEESAFCDRYNIGPPRTSVPTIEKDDRRNNEIISNL